MYDEQQTQVGSSSLQQGACGEAMGALGVGLSLHAGLQQARRSSEGCSAKMGGHV